MKWLFAFLNGLLIFVNASGLNTMTASYIFTPSDTTAAINAGDAYRQIQNKGIMKAAIFPLPRMVNWWPDEELAEEYEEVKQENVALAAENHELENVMAAGDEGFKLLLTKNDSLQLVITSMQTTIDDRQKQIDQLTETIRSGTDEFSKRLAECMSDRDKINNELRACQLSVSQLNASITNLRSANVKLRQELRTCGSKDATLAMLLQQVCNRMSLNHRSDQSLMQQDFYKRMRWAGFCESFNSWNTRIE
jgi:predicted nuclease with TOPRIM domain